MAIKTILFDLDGTLLPMDEKEFIKGYFGMLCAKLAPFGYKPNVSSVIWQQARPRLAVCWLNVWVGVLWT